MNNLFGKIVDYQIDGNDVIIQFEERKAQVSVIKEDIINFFVPVFREKRLSKAVSDLKPFHGNIHVERKDDCITIKTTKLIIEVFDNFVTDIYDKNHNILCKDYRENLDPFKRRFSNMELAESEGHECAKENLYKVCIAKEMEDNQFFYGLGEKTGHLNKKGYHYVNYNTDNPNPHGETFDRLYKSIPFMISIKDDTSFGIFFDNHFKTYFDLGRDNSKYYYFAADDGNIDYYFIYGPEVSSVVRGYTSLTGRPNLPQLWTLGYQQCRWSYDSKDRLLEIADNFRKRGIPCDTLYLDIDYMDGYRVFTWDKKKFGDPKKLREKLTSMGFKLVTIIDPGVKADPNYKIYSEGVKNGYFAKDNEGITYRNEVWPGTSVFPDFLNSKVRKWWAENQKIMVSYGADGIWNDMNEPASFNGPLPDDVEFDYDGVKVLHKEAHNVFAHFMDKATYEGLKTETGLRPFIVTRACYAGTQKYSTVWTGDNQSTWEHLRMSIPMLMNLSLSGFPICGTDVGGFGHDCTKELLSRWTQVGTFTPLFRNHAAMGTRDQEPWAFDKETEDNVKKFIKLRYKIVPYIYDMMWKMTKTGAPLIRPLLFNYQEDKNTYEINDEFMCGDNILVAPVLTQGTKVRTVYLPKGDNFIDYYTKEEFKGGQYIIKETPLDVCPIYIKSGSIVPVSTDKNYVLDSKDDNLRIDVFLGNTETETTYNHFTDDYKTFKYVAGEYSNYKIKVKSSEDLVHIKFKIVDNNFDDKIKKVKFKLYNLSSRKVIVNGENVSVEDNKIVYRIK